MAEISWAILLSKNLKQKPLYLEQIEVVVEITGDKPDPLTLQQIRENSGIESSFQDRRRNINDLVEEYNEKLKKKVTDQKHAEQLLKEFNTKLKSECDALQKGLQARVDKFTQEQKKNVNDLAWARRKLIARVVYVLAKIVQAGLEAMEKVKEAQEQAALFFTVAAVRAMIGVLKDLKGAWRDFKDAWDDERTVYKKLSDAVEAIRKIKSPKPVMVSQVEEVQKQLGAYGGKLLGADAGAKKLATELDKLLNDMEKKKFRKPDREKVAEEQVDKMIKKIQKVSKEIADGRKLMQSAKTVVQNVASRVKKDPTTFWDYAKDFFGKVDEFLEEAEETYELATAEDPFEKRLEQTMAKMQEELEEAVDEATR